MKTLQILIDFETKSFESLKYSIAENSNDILLDDSCNPDVHFFNVNFENVNTPYLFPEEFKNFLDNNSPSNYFLILHLNIRSIKKNFEKIKLFLKFIDLTFSVICFSETWLYALSITRDSLHELPNYTSRGGSRAAATSKMERFVIIVNGFQPLTIITKRSILDVAAALDPPLTGNHQIMSDRKGGGASVYIHNTFDCITRPNLSVNNKDIEAITVEIVSNKKRNTLINVLYRPPCGEVD